MEASQVGASAAARSAEPAQTRNAVEAAATTISGHAGTAAPRPPIRSPKRPVSGMPKAFDAGRTPSRRCCAGTTLGFSNSPHRAGRCSKPAAEPVVCSSRRETIPTVWPTSTFDPEAVETSRARLGIDDIRVLRAAQFRETEWPGAQDRLIASARNSRGYGGFGFGTWTPSTGLDSPNCQVSTKPEQGHPLRKSGSQWTSRSAGLDRRIDCSRWAGMTRASRSKDGSTAEWGNAT